jgi:FkbM family methyltransferase
VALFDAEAHCKRLKNDRLRNCRRWTAEQKFTFFLAGFGSISFDRVDLRKWFSRQITSYGDGHTVEVRFFVGDRPVMFSLREGNEADYSIASKFAKARYQIPNFVPEQIIDGGANIGLFSVVASATFPEARLICYEPNPTNFLQLQHNLKYNKVHAEIHQLGLWSRDATIYFHEREANTGVINEEPPGISIRCVCPIVEKNCWLKLDVEMSEYEIIPALLQNGSYPRWISMEIHQYVKRGRSLVDLLVHHGYRVRGGEDSNADCVTIAASR